MPDPNNEEALVATDEIEVEQAARAPEKLATTVAQSIYQWAAERGALVSSRAAGTQEQGCLATALGTEQEVLPEADAILQRLKVVAVTADDTQSRVGVLTKLKVTAPALEKLPQRIRDVRISYYGSTDVPVVPPHVPLSSALGGSRFYLLNGNFTCGSSVTAAPMFGAGTMGALVKLGDGTLCGMTNNHVTGDCNHTVPEMYILCPAPMDANPLMPPPTAIGQHHSFIALNSGDPTQVVPQEHDVALFRIRPQAAVSSSQGDFGFDTPSETLDPSAGMRVKKVGRTTGLTTGSIIGPFISPLLIPYQSPHFRSLVHFQGAWAIRGVGGDEFSEGGDSGSLVVTELATRLWG